MKSRECRMKSDGGIRDPIDSSIVNVHCSMIQSHPSLALRVLIVMPSEMCHADR